MKASSSRRTRYEDKKFDLLYVVLVVIILAATLVFSIVGSFNDHTYTATVTNKERINNGSKSYYLIFCQDENGEYYEFADRDNLLRLKFDSSTVYNKIEIGETYKFTVVGWRISIISGYENIVQMELVPAE